MRAGGGQQKVSESTSPNANTNDTNTSKTKKTKQKKQEKNNTSSSHSATSSSLQSNGPQIPVDAHIRNALRLVKRYNHVDPVITLVKYFTTPPDQNLVGAEGPSLQTRIIPYWVIGEFTETDPKSVEMAASLDLNNLHTTYYKGIDHQFAWLPTGINGDDPDNFGIYYTLVNRIDYLDRLANMPNLPSSMQQEIYEVQDRYQLLSLHMEMTGSYSNSELISNKDCTIPPFYLFHPKADKVFTIECLRDMFIHILYCKFWGDAVEIPYTDPEVLKIIGILAKGLPSPCKGRSVTTILPETWDRLEEEGDSLVFDTMIRMIMASLLGVYEHCKVRASFYVRRKIYKW